MENMTHARGRVNMESKTFYETIYEKIYYVD